MSTRLDLGPNSGFPNGLPNVPIRQVHSSPLDEGISPAMTTLGKTSPGKTFPTVTFTRSLWNANPPYFSVAVTSMGSANYQSTPNSDQQTGAPYMLEFTVSSATQTEIFSLTQKLNLFQGKVGKSQSGARKHGKQIAQLCGRFDPEFDYLQVFDESVDQEAYEIV